MDLPITQSRSRTAHGAHRRFVRDRCTEAVRLHAAFPVPPRDRRKAPEHLPSRGAEHEWRHWPAAEPGPARRRSKLDRWPRDRSHHAPAVRVARRPHRSRWERDEASAGVVSRRLGVEVSSGVSPVAASSASGVCRLPWADSSETGTTRGVTIGRKACPIKSAYRRRAATAVRVNGVARRHVRRCVPERHHARVRLCRQHSLWLRPAISVVQMNESSSNASG